MKKFCYALMIFSVIFLTGCQQPHLSNQINHPTMNSAKKVLLFIAFNGFQDTEHNETYQALQKAGWQTTTISSKMGTAQGKFGAKIAVENLIGDVNMNDYQALVLIGGPGAESYLQNQYLHQLARQAVQQNKVVAAICVAPAILAEAGALKGKQATVWSSAADRSFIDILIKNGAQYVEQGVVVDGNIITANGPEIAKDFAQELIKLLE